jgi:type II secretory ATPase GspE/PulE/Tfp pilus assembly ATPase PilB-like protein
MPVFADQEEGKRLDFLRKREEDELAQMLSKKYGLAVRAPENPKVLELKKQLEDQGYTVTLYMCSQESLKRAYQRYADLSYATESKAGVFELSSEELEQLMGVVGSLSDIGKLINEAIELKKAYRITRILEVILAGGLATGASDIHFEPEEVATRLRYRLDGVLVDVVTFDHETYRLMLSRLKLLSGLKLNVDADAQDGRFSIKIKGDEIELRTSILPGNYAETLVLRILNPKSIAVPLEDLGFEPKLLARIMHEIGKPNGMILTTGPTGSGKTTTLYAFLRKVNSSESKIITIEDPIEYHLQGIVQTQTDKKNYSFASGLRSALRQDPDIIMVGEIRDGEVAQVAINAALTGHLVFSTLHTNDAAGSFPRLIDLGVDEKVLSSAINAALAQRLVRKLCQVCKVERTATAEEQALINKHMSAVTDQTLVPQEKGNIWDAKEGGCDQCHNRGYKGRVGIFECVFMDSAIEEILRSKPTEREIAAAAKPQGIPTMPQDGIIKVLRGITSLEELTRVVDLEAI